MQFIIDKYYENYCPFTFTVALTNQLTCPPNRSGFWEYRGDKKYNKNLSFCAFHTAAGENNPLAIHSFEEYLKFKHSFF